MNNEGIKPAEKENELPNRFDEAILKKYYAEILDCIPEYEELRHLVADEIKKGYSPSERILDLGAGPGDSAEPILRSIPDVSIDLLDISEDMLAAAHKRLTAYVGRFQAFAEDGLRYLNNCEPYRHIYSEFTLHNFTDEGKEALLKAIYGKLTSGGTFILLDKVMPDNLTEAQELHFAQMERYRLGLVKEAADAIIKHENEDMRAGFRMTEAQTLEMIRKAGFGSVELVKRIKRDVVIRAVK